MALSRRRVRTNHTKCTDELATIACASDAGLASEDSEFGARYTIPRSMKLSGKRANTLLHRGQEERPGSVWRSNKQVTDLGCSFGLILRTLPRVLLDSVRRIKRGQCEGDPSGAASLPDSRQRLRSVGRRRRWRSEADPGKDFPPLKRGSGCVLPLPNFSLRPSSSARVFVHAKFPLSLFFFAFFFRVLGRRGGFLVTMTPLFLFSLFFAYLLLFKIERILLLFP